MVHLMFKKKTVSYLSPNNRSKYKLNEYKETKLCAMGLLMEAVLARSGL